jgi:signal transduction histidine kinase
VREAVRQLLAEPRVPNPPQRVWRDWVLIALLVPAAVVEVFVRDDLGWPPVALVLGVTQIIALLWRRSHPLTAVAVGFGVHAASEAVLLFGADHSAMLMTSASILILPYSLFRWGAGRQCAIGLAVMLIPHIPHGASIASTLFQAVVGTIVLLFPAAIGAAMRYRSSSKVREIDQVKMREREQLARELHDTVAHHVSAIIIQAQAGRTVAGSDPAAAVNALRVIEAEATRTLGEMRVMVGVLRQGDGADLAPQRGVADIKQLSRQSGNAPQIQVELADGLEDLRPSVGAAMYRLAQESITNALRHARHATLINVSVTADDENVRLTVCDNGEATSSGHVVPGYGLIGMSERTKLLGGSFVAGPNPSSGWTTTAVLPRDDARV